MLTVEQAAESIQVTPETVRRWLRAGQLAGVRPGSKKLGWRIRQSEVERFLSGAQRAEDQQDIARAQAALADYQQHGGRDLLEVLDEIEAQPSQAPEEQP